MRRLLMFVILACAVAVPTVPAAAATVRGPAGLRVVRPPSTVTCPPVRLRVSVRFTAASARRGVRGARIELQDTGTRKTIRTKRRGVRRVHVVIPCGVTFRIRIAALGRSRKVLGRKSFRTTSKAAVGAPTPEPGPPPSIDVQLPGSSTTWSVIVDPRRTGTRAGQTCVQVSATTPQSGLGISSYCGLLSEDPFFVRTQESDDPSGGAKKLVLAGAASLASVASISVTSTAGTQQLAFGAPEETPHGTDAGFIAVWDASTTKVRDLVLVVTLKNGTTQSYAEPRSINLRKQNGQRI